MPVEEAVFWLCGSGIISVSIEGSGRYAARCAFGVGRSGRFGGGVCVGVGIGVGVAFGSGVGV